MSTGEDCFQSVIVSITLSADDYLRYYSGSAKKVSTKDVYGKRIQFPAGILQKFVTHTGISGVFEIFFDQAGKFVTVERLPDR